MEATNFAHDEIPLRPGPNGEIGILSAMVEAMKLVEPIAKNKYNQQQNFRYRGIDDFLNLMSPILKQVGVLVIPQELETVRNERETARGGVLFVEHKRVRYTFFHVDGSSVSAVLQGTGMDSADKAGNKALSAAYKYAVTQVFCVPVDDVHVDSEQDDYEVRPKGGQRPQANGRPQQQRQQGNQQGRSQQQRPQPAPQPAAQTAQAPPQQPEPEPDSKATDDHIAKLDKYAHLLSAKSQKSLSKAVQDGTLTYGMVKMFSAEIRSSRERAAKEPPKPDGREQAAQLYGGYADVEDVKKVMPYLDFMSKASQEAYLACDPKQVGTDQLAKWLKEIETNRSKLAETTA